MSMKTMAARIAYLGGDQLDRIDKQKLRTLKSVLKNSYNSRPIRVPNGSVWDALITTSSGGLKSQRDRKELSVEFESGLKPGETFELLEDCTHWMVYLPILTETAYLRAEILRCNHQLEVNGQKYWIYLNGPVETDLRWFLKNNINANELNLSGTIYIKNDENTKEFFKRFTRIKIDGHVWEVQVTDSLTVPGIIELEIQEYYDNTIEELPEIKKVSDAAIIGVTTVKQDTVVGYSIDPLKYDPSLSWEVKNNPRVRIDEILEDGRICKVQIHQGAVKTFDLCYGDEVLTITIDWKKPAIQGPQVVYPYDVHKYWMKDKQKVTFAIDNSDMATITNFGDDWCEVDIIYSKKGIFTLSAAGTTDDGEEINETLEVEIKSL